WAATGKLALFGRSLAEAGEIGHMVVKRAVRVLPLWISDLWPSHGDEVGAIAWWCGFLLILWTGRRYARLSVRGLWRFWLTPLFLTAALYLVTPFRVGAAGLLNVRLAPLLPLFGLLALRTRRNRWATIALCTIVAGLVTTSVNAAYVMRKQARA